MAVYKLVDSAKLDACLDAEADAIRAKTGGSSPISFDLSNEKGFADAIAAIPQGTTPTGTKQISISQNGTTTENVSGYASAEIIANVPNTYAAGDEGKVVSNGALVAQTAHADVTPTTSDQTIDTTTNNSTKVKGDANLVAGNIKKDVVIFNTTGTYEGGGGSSAQIATGTFTGDGVNSTVDISCAFEPDIIYIIKKTGYVAVSYNSVGMFGVVNDLFGLGCRNNSGATNMTVSSTNQAVTGYTIASNSYATYSNGTLSVTVTANSQKWAAQDYEYILIKYTP